MKSLPLSNFAHLQSQDEQLVRLGLLAEKYFPEDPNTCLLKLRQMAELLAQSLAAHVGLLNVPEETQYDLVRRLKLQGILPREVADLFDKIRVTGNQANHALRGDHQTALRMMKFSWLLGIWFHRTVKDPNFKSGPFIPPTAPKDESEELRQELAELKQEREAFQFAHQDVAQRLETTEAKLRDAQTDQAFWEEMAASVEQEKAEIEKRLAAAQAVAVAQQSNVAQVVNAANQAAASLDLSEADTRKIIDEQLQKAGWLADSVTLRYSKGVRPEKGKNLAIAEWPTGSGPADYALFISLTPVATIEAKRKNVDVSGALQQAKRYSRDFKAVSELESASGPWGEFRVPFAFSANGRPFLRQLETRSGIWFCDVRRPENLSRPLDGWYTPEGLMALLKQDHEQAQQKLAVDPF